MGHDIKDETLEKIKEIQAKINQSNDNLEKMMLKHHELNPLMLLWAELTLKEQNII